MNDQQLHERIAYDPKIIVGKPLIKGTRLAVEYILTLLAHGSSATDILDEHEGLTLEDIQTCLFFASQPLSSTRLF